MLCSQGGTSDSVTDLSVQDVSCLGLCGRDNFPKSYA